MKKNVKSITNNDNNDIDIDNNNNGDTRSGDARSGDDDKGSESGDDRDHSVSPRTSKRKAAAVFAFSARTNTIIAIVFVVALAAVIASIVLLARSPSASQVTRKREYMRTRFRDTIARREGPTIKSLPAKNDYHCGNDCQCTSGGTGHYGIWCGFRYGPCDSGVPPCDEVDAACRTHDYCTGTWGLTNCNCTLALYNSLECIYIGILLDGDKNTWPCEYRLAAIEDIAADLRFLLPQCFKKQTP